VKILFLNNFHYLRGGSERILLEEMRLLREAGHEVALYARSHQRNDPAPFEAWFPPHLELEGLGFSLKTLRALGELVYSAASRRGLREVLARFRPDIVHAHNIYGRLSLSVLDELKAARVPVIMTLHDLKLLCPSYLMLNAGKPCELCKGHRYHHAVLTRCHKGSYAASLVYALESWFNHGLGKYDSVSRFIAPSRFLRDKCLEYGWDGAKFSYLPNFSERFLAVAPPEAGGYLLYAGRLSPEKGVSGLLQAYHCLTCQIPLVIAGEGPQREALQRYAVQQGLPVTFAGHLGGDALQAALAGARVLVIPSQCYENAPLSVLEAFAAGKPVLGARIGGIPELIEDGVNGFLFAASDPAALAGAIERFLSLSGPQVALMGEAARAGVARDFSEKRHLALLLELYRQVLESPRQGRTPTVGGVL